MPSASSGRIAISPFAISLVVIAVALLALAVFWFTDSHTKRAILALVGTAVVAGGAGYSVYAGI